MQHQNVRDREEHTHQDHRNVEEQETDFETPEKIHKIIGRFGIFSAQENEKYNCCFCKAKKVDIKSL